MDLCCKKTWQLFPFRIWISTFLRFLISRNETAAFDKSESLRNAERLKVFFFVQSFWPHSKLVILAFFSESRRLSWKFEFSSEMEFCHQRHQTFCKNVHISFLNDWKRFCARSISVWYRRSSQMKNSARFFFVRSELKSQRIANRSLSAILSVFSCVKSLYFALWNVEIQDFSRIQLTELGVQRNFLQKSHILATFPKFLAALKARNSDFFSVFFC